MSRDILISIHPRFSQMIRAGVKRVELRRVAPKMSPGTKVYVYTSSPKMSIESYFTLKEQIEASPDVIWGSTNSFNGLTHEEFRKYYTGAAKGICLHIDQVYVADKGILLGDLRDIDISPPQSFRYIDEKLKSIFAQHRWRLNNEVKIKSKGLT